jgi:hypothetical protein
MTGPDDDTSAAAGVPAGRPNAGVSVPDITATVVDGLAVSAVWNSPPEIRAWHVQLLSDVHAPIRAVSVSQRRVRLTGLWQETNYGLRVRAVDHDGRVSAWSDISMFSTGKAEAREELVDKDHGGGVGAEHPRGRGAAVHRPMTASSSARRFVILPAAPVADGVQFADGLVVVRSRTSMVLEIYPHGVGEIPIHVRRELAWVDDEATR